tara:strand:+ start:90 stop:233 length:144 start_codon:yes stop_codon:yes gene_type:complete
MLLKRLIILIFIASIGSTIIYFIFWDLPAPSKQIERIIDINRLKTYD